jgi:hypothetical protein
MTTENLSFKLTLDHQNKVLAHYQKQVQQQQLLLNCIKATLPADLAERACYCVMAQCKVLIYTDSAVWASQLRFYANTILSKLVQSPQYSYLETIQIRILSPSPVVATTRQARIPSAQIIKQFAEDSTQHSDALSLALMNLSQTLARKLNDNAGQQKK